MISNLMSLFKKVKFYSMVQTNLTECKFHSLNFEDFQYKIINPKFLLKVNPKAGTNISTRILRRERKFYFMIIIDKQFAIKSKNFIIFYEYTYMHKLIFI